jgi:multidrug efflux pump subunit AcrA (membrane-fusion protein)
LLPEVASFICQFDAFADIDIPARLHEVGTEALATTRTYPVTLIMDQPQGAAILPGMSGKVRIRLKPGAMGTAGGMIVPVAAVFANEQDQKFVWVVDPQTKRVNRKQVQVTRVLPQGLLIEGLTPGTWVVNAGVHFLTENQEVRLPMTEGDAS